MPDYKDISVENYRYKLPEEKIAKYPLGKRDNSKLLVYNNGQLADDKFYNISKHLDSCSTLVFNNTRVIRSRLIFSKPTGAKIEIFCLEPHIPSSYEQSLESTSYTEWKCLVGNLKKWKQGNLSLQIKAGGQDIKISAEKVRQTGEKVIVAFSWNRADITFGEIMELSGHVPVPPYLNREDEPLDKIRYQTIYSNIDGSVAAPTAGLHFSDRVFDSIKAKGLGCENITLHVGAGTFVPVKTATIGGHQMHKEHFSVSRQSLEAIITDDIVAVGTTSVRTIESLFTLGNKLLEGYNPENSYPEIKQWDLYETKSPVSVEESLRAVMNYMDNHETDILKASTSAIIVPGYKFRIVKGLISNFHMPASTLLLLVSALIGEDWLKVYMHALNNDYRFLSYGDSSLLLPKG